MNNKYLHIKVVNDIDVNNSPLYVSIGDVRNVMRDVKNANINAENAYVMWKKAINIILWYFAVCGVSEQYIDIDKHDAEYAASRKMTLSEIEQVLGYKIEIVEEKQDDHTR